MLSKYAFSSMIALLMIIALVQLSSGIKIASKAWASQYLIESAWSKTLSGEREVRPWPWADTWPVAELQLPRLGVRQLVLEGDSGRVLAFGPGMNQVKDSGLDIELRILSGHRDTHFNFLKDIELGDTFEIKTVDGSTQLFEVFDSQVVGESWTLPASAVSGDKLAILVTCYPVEAISSGAEQRYMVFARSVQPVTS